MSSYSALSRDPALPVENPTTSFWQIPLHEKLRGIQSKDLPVQSDIVVIGSGISSCSVVRQLLTGGFAGSITVLEAREICSGATGRNGGRLHVHAVQDFDRFRRKYGDEAAKAIIRFQFAHHAELESVAKTLDDQACKRAAIRDTESVTVAFSADKFAELKTLLASFEDAFPDLVGRYRIVGVDEAREKYRIPNAEGAMVGSAGAAWPYRFVTGVFAKMLDTYQGRLSVESYTPVLSVSRFANESYPYALRTPRGIIRARNVVYCTEAHTAHLLPSLRGLLVPRRGHMSVQRPGSIFQGLNGSNRSWNFVFDVGHDYLHQNPDSGDIFLGGGDLGGFDSGLDIFGVASDANESMAVKAHLTGILPAVYGEEVFSGITMEGKNRMVASWCGTLGYSLDHVPMVGRLPREVVGWHGEPHSQKNKEWICAGFGGFGMTNSWLCGKALALQITGEPAPAWLPEVYRMTPSRMFRLRKHLSELIGTKEHLRALM